MLLYNRLKENQSSTANNPVQCCALYYSFPPSEYSLN